MPQRFPVARAPHRPPSRATSASHASASTSMDEVFGRSRAPAACWCARTTVESALTVQSLPSASSQPTRSPAQDLLPGPVAGPAPMPVVDGLPVPEPLRQVPPRAPGPGPEEDPVDHHPVIGPPAAARRTGRQEDPQPVPFLICQIMTVQLIKHPTDLHDPTIKIHGTRPSGGATRGSGTGFRDGVTWTAAANGNGPANGRIWDEKARRPGRRS